MDRRKAFVLFGLLAAACAFVLSQPLWAEGGMSALIENRDRRLTWWPVAALAASLMIPVLAYRTVSVALWSAPAVFIDRGTLMAFNWRCPIPVEDVKSVTLDAPGARVWAQGVPYVELKSGRRLLLPNLVVGEPLTMLRRLSDALTVPLHDGSRR